MKIKTNRFPILLAALAVSSASAHAAVITIADYSFVPDGTATTNVQGTDVNAQNSGNVLPATNGTIVYVISTFTFGTASDAHLQWQFGTAVGSRNRIGLEVDDAGLVQSIGTANGILQNISPTTNKRSNVNLAMDMAGQTITLVAKLYYNSEVSSDLGARTAALPNGSESTSDDTIMNVWINPDITDVEGDISSHAAMIGNGDMYAVWNSASFFAFHQTILNQSTPGTSGTSTIGATTILTGTDATFANAMNLAIPEPSSALLGGLGMLALLRRRRS